MKKLLLSLALVITPPLFATAPIQRIDVANQLWNSAAGGNGGLTQTDVTVDFYNGGTSPCYTATLKFQNFITVYAGPMLTCVAPISEIAFTTIANFIGLVYSAPDSNTLINTQYYSSQVIISQLTAPQFDPSNATLLAAGTSTTSISAH